MEEQKKRTSTLVHLVLGALVALVVILWLDRDGNVATPSPGDTEMLNSLVFQAIARADGTTPGEVVEAARQGAITESRG